LFDLLVFCVVFCRSLFVLLSLLLCSLCCLSFCDLRLLQTFLRYTFRDIKQLNMERKYTTNISIILHALHPYLLFYYTMAKKKKDKQRSTKHSHKTKDRLPRTPCTKTCMTGKLYLLKTCMYK
jgi:hypothetical protein